MTRDPACPMFGFPIAPWHDWFAWRPVRTWTGQLVWLQTVQRRMCQKSSYLPGPIDMWFQYQVRQ